MKWKDITLAQFQEIERINSRQLSDMDKALFSVCVIYGVTEYELDSTDPKKALKMVNRVTQIFESSFIPKAQNKIGRYFINYEVSSMSFGQYIELAFFLQDSVRHAHYIMATISKRWLQKHTASDHRKKSEFFLSRPVTEIIGCVGLIKVRFDEFNNEYKPLFGLDKAVAGDVQADDFNKRHGWIYSATQVKEHEGITLEETFSMPVRQALNALVFLKAKGKYEVEQLRKAKSVA
jgi:hypothetical protein